MRRFLIDVAAALTGVVTPPVTVIAVIVGIVQVVLWLMK